MQPSLPIFLALLLAHIVGDFPLQTGRMVAAKHQLIVSAFVRHGLIHLVLAAAALAVFTPVVLWSPPIVGALALLTLGHVALDVGKSSLIRWRPALDGSLLYLADQLLHVVIVGVATLVAVQTLPPFDLISEWWRLWRYPALVSITIVAATVFPAGYLIRYLLQPMSQHLPDTGEIDELANAGLYLGWLERGLLVIAFAAGSLTAVGLIVGAKSIARFPEFKTRAFAEYFLIGTLISVAIAAAGGWILRLALAAI